MADLASSLRCAGAIRGLDNVVSEDFQVKLVA